MSLKGAGGGGGCPLSGSSHVKGCTRSKYKPYFAINLDKYNERKNININSLISFNICLGAQLNCLI